MIEAHDRLEPVVLDGRHVRLEPLTLDHLPALCEVGLDSELWRWSPTAVRDAGEMRSWLEAALFLEERGEALPFAIVARGDGRVVGSTRFGNLDLANLRVEIGWTWVAGPWQRTAVNTEAKLLLLAHAFDALGCIRVEFKTDALNEQSRRALARIGAREEGVLRKHMVTASGRLRDTVYYSILDEEWPAVADRLRQMLESR